MEFDEQEDEGATVPLSITVASPEARSLGAIAEDEETQEEEGEATEKSEDKRELVMIQGDESHEINSNQKGLTDEELNALSK